MFGAALWVSPTTFGALLWASVALVCALILVVIIRRLTLRALLRGLVWLGLIVLVLAGVLLASWTRGDRDSPLGRRCAWSRSWRTSGMRSFSTMTTSGIHRRG